MKKLLLLTSCSALLSGVVASSGQAVFAQEDTGSAAVEETVSTEASGEELTQEEASKLQTDFDAAVSRFNDKYTDSQLVSVKVHKHSQTGDYVFYLSGESGSKVNELVVYQDQEYSALPGQSLEEGEDESSESQDLQASQESEEATTPVEVASSDILELFKYVKVDEASQTVGVDEPEFLTLELIDDSELELEGSTAEVGDSSVESAEVVEETATSEDTETSQDSTTTEADSSQTSEATEEVTLPEAQSSSKVPVYKFITKEADAYKLALVNAETGEEIPTPEKMQTDLDQFFADLESGTIANDDVRVFWFTQFYDEDAEVTSTSTSSQAGQATESAEATEETEPSGEESTTEDDQQAEPEATNEGEQVEEATGEGEEAAN